MHFALTDEQRAIQETALAFARERLAPKAGEWDETAHFPVDVIREMAALGMATIYVPAEKGGSGLSRLDGALIFEALSYGCPAIAAYISIHNMVAWMLAKYGTEAQVAHWIPKLASMELLSSYCLTEPQAGSDAAALATRAERKGDHFVLNGTKQFISGAGATDLYFVFARTGGPGAGGVSAFLLEKGMPGLSFGANERKMGWNAQPDAAGHNGRREGARLAPRRGGGGARPRLPVRDVGPRRRADQYRRLLARTRGGGARPGEALRP